MELTCNANGCTAPVHGRGYCRRHYDALRNHGDLEIREPVQVCTITGCERPHLARGWCALHHQRWQRHGDPEHVAEPVAPAPRVCVEDGCQAPVKAQDRCDSHYAKQRRSTLATCESGCPGKIHARGMCQPCYRRWRHAQDTGGEFTPMEPKVEVQPLLDAIEAQGGLDVCYRASGLTKRAKSALDKMLRRATERGHMPVSSADKLAIDLLSMHPCFVYGETWWGEVNGEGFLEPRPEEEGLVAA